MEFFAIFHWDAVPKPNLTGKQLRMATMMKALFVLGGKNAPGGLWFHWTADEMLRMKSMDMHLINRTALFAAIVTKDRQACCSRISNSVFYFKLQHVIRWNHAEITTTRFTSYPTLQEIIFSEVFKNKTPKKMCNLAFSRLSNLFPFLQHRNHLHLLAY